MMKWTYKLETESDHGQVIEGSVYGTFLEAIGQVNHAVAAEGWSRNSVAVYITITPVSKEH